MTQIQGAAGTTALAVANPWAVVPSLGNLDSYISAVNRLPMLTPEEEYEFAKRFKEQNDLEAVGRREVDPLTQATPDPPRSNDAGSDEIVAYRVR